MAKRIVLEPTKTYATIANLEKAVDKVGFLKNSTYIVCTNEDGRFFPAFTNILNSKETLVTWVCQVGFCVVG